MQDRQRHHIIVDSKENVPTVLEQLKQSSLTDLKTWVAFPLLISASLTKAQVDWLKRHPMISFVEPNSAVYLHADPKQYEIKPQPGADLQDIRASLFEQFDIELWQFDDLPDVLFTTLDEDSYTRLSMQIQQGNFPDILSLRESINPVREFTRVLNLDRYNWGIERISHRNTRLFERVSFTQTGENVNVFVLDNGVQSNHDELRGRVSPQRYDAFRDMSDPLYGEPSTSTSMDGSQITFDDHGTHVASIIAGSTVGVAPSATIYSVRVFSNDSEEPTTINDILLAVEWTITMHTTIGGASIVNMSFGIQDAVIGNMYVSDLITQALINVGIITVVSAGNDATDAFFTKPAGAGAKREVRQEGQKYFLDTIIDPAIKPITVGASVSPRSTARNTDGVWSKSNWGDVVDIFAPGVNIFAASLQQVGDSIDLNRTSAYAVKSGTSMAAPHVAGICALHLSKDPTLTHQQMRELIIEQATKNPFNIAETRHTRVDPVRYRQVGSQVVPYVFENTTMYSPNRLAFAWFTLSRFNWTDQSYTLEVDEHQRLEAKISASSTNYYGDNELVDYEITQLDVPVEYPLGFPLNFTSTEYVSTDGNIVENINVLNLRIDAPSVPETRIGSFEIQAYDGRVRGFRRLTIQTNNVPAPPVWQSPAAGELFATPKHKGDVFAQSTLEFVATQEDNLPITYTIIPLNGSLPLGLNLRQDQVGNKSYLSGTIVSLPYSQEPIKYEFLIRATAGNGLIAERLFTLTCEYQNSIHYFNPDWLVGFYEIEPSILMMPPARIGNTYYQAIDVVNEDNDVLTYAIDFVPGIVEGPGVFNGRLPTGLGIFADGSIRGIVDPTVVLGLYYIRLTVTDVEGNEIAQNFRITVEIGDDDVLQESDQIIWVTPPGSIGNIYETFPSHVLVEAINPEGTPVVYSVSPNGGPLPDGLTVQSTTGYIMGFAPFVSADTTYTFAIRATVGARYVDRTFSITILNQYESTNIRNVKGRITGYERQEFKDWLVDSPILTREVLFRPGDPNFGAVDQLELYVVSGLNTQAFDESGNAATMVEILKDYHKRMYLTYGPLTYAPVYDPSGSYICDVIYFSLVDPQAKAGGFNADGSEHVLTLPQSHPYDPDLWDAQTGESRFYPNSLGNAREDLISTVDGRLGFGLAGEEGMPMWMRTTSNPRNTNLKPRGYTPAIILAYVKPGKGLQVSNQLALRGLTKQFQGRELILDRYYVSNSLIAALTTFDDNLTTFDVPGIPFTCVKPVFCAWDPNTETQTCDPQAGQITACDVPESTTDAPTQFDVGTTELGKYYKFNDDVRILRDRGYPEPEDNR